MAGKHARVDIIATVILSVVAVAFGMLAFFASGFFAMAADGCPACDEHTLDLVYPVTWGGFLLTAVGTAAGLVVSAWRGRRMWHWPVLAMVLVVVFFGIGLTLADAGSHAPAY